jgi:hypothetical protein
MHTMLQNNLMSIINFSITILFKPFKHISFPIIKLINYKYLWDWQANMLVRN